jgi:hypothetical protein
VAALFATIAACFKTPLNFVWKTSHCDKTRYPPAISAEAAPAHAGGSGFLGLDEARLDNVLMIVKPETVLAWHRKGFRKLWTWRVRRGKPHRPSIPQEIRDLIRIID